MNKPNTGYLISHWIVAAITKKKTVYQTLSVCGMWEQYRKFMGKLNQTGLIYARKWLYQLRKNTRLTFPFLGTTWVSQYQKGKTVPESNETRDDNIRGWQWHLALRCRQTARQLCKNTIK